MGGGSTGALKLMGNLSRQEGGLLVSQLGFFSQLLDLDRRNHQWLSSRRKGGPGNGQTQGIENLWILLTADVKASADAAIRGSFGTA